MNKKPSTITPILYAVLAAILFVTANRPGTHPAIMIILNVAGAGCAVMAAVEFAWLCLLRWVEVRGDLARIANESPESLLYSIIARMTAAQLAAIEKNVPAVLVLGGGGGPRYELKTPGGNVPFEAVREFFRRSPNGAIVPLRAYGEGSAARQYAQWLTDYFVFHGLARVAAGNQSAQWLDRARALASIGMAEEEEGEG